MKKHLFLLIFLCQYVSTFAQNSDQSKLYEIGGIEVIGLQSSERQAVIAMSGLRIGDKIQIPGPATNKAIRALWKQKLFTDIKIVQGKIMGDIVFLEINLKELPRFKRYTLNGTNKTETATIKGILDRHLTPGTIVNTHDQSQIEEDLKDFYEEKSYLDAQINFHEIVDSVNNTLLLNITIDKKEKVKVAKIHFQGNSIVTDQKLRKQMSTKTKACLLCKAQLIKEQLEADKKSIIAYYNTLGYRDVKIVQDSIWRDQTADLHILIKIDEGRRYFVRNIEWIGNSVYSDADLNQVYGIKKGDIFNQSLLDQKLHFDPNGYDISSIYMDIGYLFLDLDMQESIVGEDSIDLKIRIQEGPQATIGKVSIKGNEKTHEHVIRRELRTLPGQKFSRDAVIRSQREIINLGYFNPEKLGINTAVNPNDGTVDIEYTVEEQNSDKIELSAGWQPGTEDVDGGVVGTFGVNFTNFSFRNLFSRKWNGAVPGGDGQTLNMRVQSTGAGYQSYNLSITEPWLGGKTPTSLTVAGYYQRYTNGQPVGNESFESLSILGLSGIVAKPLRLLNGNLISTTELTYKDIRLNKLSEILLDDGSTLNQGNFNNFYIKQTLTYNTLIDPFFPKKGVRISLSGQFTPPYSLFSDKNIEDQPLSERYNWLEYHKWRFSTEWYTSIGKELVLKASAKMGWLGSYNDALGTPPFERFEMGGNGWNIQQAGFTGNDIFALRGYDEGYIEGTKNGGGAAFSKFTVELRRQILKGQMARAYVLAFAEGGNVWKNVRDFDPLNLYRSAGLGIRINLPMLGLIGFDYGIGFDKPELSGQKWSSFGRLSFIIGLEPE